MPKNPDFVVTARCFVCDSRFEFYPTAGQDIVLCECGRMALSVTPRCRDKIADETPCHKNPGDLENAS